MSNANLEALVERAFEQRTDTLAEVIRQEHLEEYELGHEDIIYADDINWAVVPCEDRMIIAREHYDFDAKKIVAEYAIYSQHDHDGENISNSLNMNAVYRLESIGQATFANMAYAIAHAADLVRNMKEE
jgi:hypothetical protein